MTEDRSSVDDRAVVGALAAAATRLEAADRLRPDHTTELLQSIVDATVAIFAADAASLALYDAAADRLVFRVASGEQGSTVIGLEVAPGDGVAGYVFATGEPLAIADVTEDARFARSTAELTGYLPRALLAVPLVDDGGVHGVLEILDRTDGRTFSLRDIEAAMLFARQACTAIAVTRADRHGTRLIRATIDAAVADSALTGADLDAFMARISAELAGDDDPIWQLADRIGRLRDVDPDDAGFVVTILDALIARQAPRRRRSSDG